MLRWAADAGRRLAQLDVSEEALAGLSRRVDDLAGQVVAASVELSALQAAAASGLAAAVTAELAGLAMADADFTVGVVTMAAREGRHRPLLLPTGNWRTPAPTGSTWSSSASPRTAAPTCCR